ncbi:glycoside hydrolase family 31 protein [Flavivirga rizhaonensis]|uniref:Glycoside hydrolase family 31 protein n=1 Tax=Flavivirga rizhaonensis TaxID=2559571 RepID=A0A4S1DX52_9FLAO|nr:TIM-barrel domain-containing protein [Flavivirga rizhaonensis]TGV02811.1 glycoside hydrolase family 31 protein [Flavivirga rizhaonensis]
MNYKKIQKTITTILISLLFFSCNTSKITKTNNGVIAEITNSNDKVDTKIKISVLSPTIVKVATAKTDSILYVPSLIASEFLEKEVAFDISENEDSVEITTDSLIVKLNLLNGTISYADLDGSLLLTESGKEISPYTNDIIGNQNRIKQNFNWTKNEVLYGLGQHNQNSLSLRSKKIELIQENTKVSVPVILSTKGYGIYWDNYSRTIFNDSGDTSYISSEVGDKIQYYFVKGNRFDNIIANLRMLTGEVPMLPKWALGYIQSRNRYKDREELMGVVKKQRKKGIPLDAIILDYLHWGDRGFGSMIFDETDFPDAEGMINELHENYNCKLIVSVWPSFHPSTENWKLFKKDNFLLDLDMGNFGTIHDAFNPKAGQLYYDLVKKNYLDKGVDAIWYDSTEAGDVDRLEKAQSYMGPIAKRLNLYSYFDMKNIYERQIQSAKNRIVILTRSAFLGQQKFGSIVWSGDIGTDFKTLREQVPTGLNFCMTGIPYWNTDIGGYLGGDPKDPKYQEVFTRWFQYGTFTPFFRAHGRRVPSDTRSGENEIWSYGADKEKILTDYINLRYRLLPYIYTLSHKVSAEGYTMMRALAFDFMADEKVHEISDQFMFGDDILVCPVLEAGAIKRAVYLPKGTKWFNFWTNESYNGGQTIEANAPIETIPLFVKAGSILPMGEAIQYASEKNNDILDLMIYGDEDATFTIYEDENDNYNYKEGKFSQIPLTYTAKDKTLTIGALNGGFNGMPHERTFNIFKISEKSGISTTLEKPLSVNYNGNELKIKL